MKKNVMMRVASALLVAVLLSTCAISGTFAKYVTTESGSDQARVAKWGVEIVADSFNMFTDTYATDDTTATFTGTYSVDSNDDKDVFAPGTEGSFANFAITGTPEVAVEVAVVSTVTVSDKWIVDGDFYCPIVVTVGTTDIAGTSYTSATDFAVAIETAIEDYSEQYAPNKDLTEITNGTNFDISWAWEFSTSADNDVKDTKLGNAAAAGEDLSIKIDVAITVTQID